MTKLRIIECVPNFSEGQNIEIIDQIAQRIEKVPGVILLNVDPGKSTNRTVITFVGNPDSVIEAAFEAFKTAQSLIDMKYHKGEHPRMGAVDVCPLIPISGITMDETVVYAKKLAEKVGRELQIPVYLYEAAASAPHRKNLADIRQGEYEGFEEKIKLPEWIPDFGPSTFNAKSGASVIGARDFLIAYNVNLNTKSVALANEVAYDVREQGRPAKDPLTQKVILDETGEIKRIPGLCKSVKGIGWYIEEYRQAQVSMNLTNVNETSVHEAFEACRKSAESRGLLVTGSEIVGLVPKKSLIDAGLYFLQKQKRSAGLSEIEIIDVAIQSMGLNSVNTFDPKTRIIDYMLDEKRNPLAEMSLIKFAEETASENPAPGGGSAAAYVGALGAALGTMVANLTAHKKGFEDKFDFFSDHAKQGQYLCAELLKLVDEDTRAFNEILNAFRLPKSTEEEKTTRKKAIQKATIYAIDIPLQTMKAAFECLPLIRAMIEQGNPNSISDAGVGALCVQTAVQGAGLNVRINASGLKNEEKKSNYLIVAKKIEADTIKEVQELIQIIKSGLK